MIHNIAVFIAIFASGILAGYLLKCYMLARELKQNQKTN